MIYYQDQITITDTLIMVSKDETLNLMEVREPSVQSFKVGDYREGSYLFILLGVISMFFIIPLALWLFMMAIGARFTPKFKHRLVVKWKGDDKVLMYATLRECKKGRIAIRKALNL